MIIKCQKLYFHITIVHIPNKFIQKLFNKDFAYYTSFQVRGMTWFHFFFFRFVIFSEIILTTNSYGIS